MKIKAVARKEQGTSASRRLRRAGNVPGIIYGDGPAMAITLDHNNLWHTMRQEGAHSSIIELDIDGKKSNVITRDIQYHPYKPFITHIDFQRINMKKTLVMRVPLVHINAEESPAVKVDGQIINQIVHEIEVECLPTNLPEHIVVDLAKLEANSTITLSQLVLPKGVSVVHHGSDEEDPTLIATTHASEEDAAEGSTEATTEADDKTKEE